MKLKSGMSAVVTGGASGLGEATARALSARGLRVGLFDLDEARGHALAVEIGGVFVRVDVSDVESVVAGFTELRSTHGQERLMVNCAGIAPPGKTVSKGEPHDATAFEKVIRINLIGSFLCASRSATGMVAADPLNDDGERGVIVNTSSIAAYEGQMGQAAYAASKGGVAGMTLPMARDLARDGVRVVSIAPGLFGTPMLRGLPEEVQESLAAQVPFPARLGDPAEYAALVCHVAENPMLNGEVIRLDGAIRMGPR